jgi:regulator of cell morphogenesis and NO signaling
LPKIREDLVKALPQPHNDLTKAIIGYFDKYVAEVNRHMKYEERMVFPYVRELLAGNRPDDYSIEVFSKRHDQVESKLTEFKEILIKYYPAKSTNEINGVLFDIFNCEHDLASHNEVEDRLFVPAIIKLERKTGTKR